MSAEPVLPESEAKVSTGARSARAIGPLSSFSGPEQVAQLQFHNLNNALMVASACCELIADPQAPEHRRPSYAAKAQTALLQAAQLVKDMQQAAAAQSSPLSVEREWLDIDQLMEELWPILLKQSQGQTLTLRPGAGGREVFVNRQQFGQLVMQAIRFVEGRSGHEQLGNVLPTERW